MGAALWAMTKCNNTWPQQLFDKVQDAEDEYNIRLYHPQTRVPFDPIPMTFDKLHNIDANQEEIAVSKRW